VQVATGQGRLQHVGRVHGSLGATRADQRVQFVDKQHHRTLRFRDLLEHGLQPLLELAAVLGPRQHAAQVEGHDALVLETLGHVSRHYAVGQAFDDGRLAHARVADQHGVVLAPARQHLDHAQNLLVTADDRIELARACLLREVTGVLGERIERRLRIRRGHRPALTHFAQRRLDLLGGDSPRGEETGDLRVTRARQRQEEVLGGDVLVAQLARRFLRAAQYVVQGP